jgi:hypothetical protein
VVQHHVEQDHLGTEAAEVVDHLGVIAVAPGEGTELGLGLLVDGDQRDARVRSRGRKQAILRGEELRFDEAGLDHRPYQQSRDQCRERRTPGGAPVAYALADHGAVS